MYKWNNKKQWNYSKTKRAAGGFPYRMVGEGLSEPWHWSWDPRGGVEPACDDMTGAKAGRREWAEPARDPTTVNVTVHNEAREGAGTRPGRTLPSVLRRLDFFLSAKGSHLRVSSREVTWTDLFVKDKLKGRKDRKLAFSVGDVSSKGSLSSAHSPSNCGRHLLWGSLGDAAWY